MSDRHGCRGAKRQKCPVEPLASLNTPYPVTHREASSRYVIRFRSLTRKSFMTCQSVCHMALEYCRSNLTHLRFFAFAGHDSTSPCFFIMLYTVRPLMFLSANALVTRPTPEQPLLHSASTISTSSSDIVLVAGRPPLLIVGNEPVLLYLAQRRRTCRELIFMLSAIVALRVSFSRMTYLILSSSSLTGIRRLG